MTQTLPVRTFLARFRAFMAGPPVATRTIGGETEEAAREPSERRRYEEYLHWGFSPYSAW
jgi:hypothetical protein